MPTLEDIFEEAIRKIQDFRATDRPLPKWLQKQAAGIYESENNLDRGMRTFMDGMQQEVDRYKELEDE